MRVNRVTLPILAALSFSLASVPAETPSAKRTAKLRPLLRPVTPKPRKPPAVYTPSNYRHRGTPRSRFPWRRDIMATVFWVGERPTPRNPTPNHASSWDPRWQISYGGYDDPNPANRTTSYRPKAFIPRQNPFYVALPYNDLQRGRTKTEARRVIPWFKQRFIREGRTTLKGQWLVIHNKNRFCFAQWEDCGPFSTDDWPYVFGRSRPRNRANNAAGIDVSPAVRDYLRIKGAAKVDWRFVSSKEVRSGPWKYYGRNNHFAKAYVPPKRATIDQLDQRRTPSPWRRRGGTPVRPRS